MISKLILTKTQIKINHDIDPTSAQDIVDALNSTLFEKREIDLKRGKLTHQDVGQMDMYVRMYDDLEKGENDNPTIGIILCTDKDNTVVKYSVLNDNENLFVSKYQLYLPTEAELKAEIEKDIFELELRVEDDG